MRCSLAVCAVVFMTLLCIGLAAAEPGGTALPAQTTATDVRVIIILDAPPAPVSTPVSADRMSTEPVSLQARSMAAETLQEPVVAELEQMAATEIRELPVFNAVACNVSSSDLETIREMPGVARVVPDRVIRLPDEPQVSLQDVAFGGIVTSGDETVAWGVDRIGAPAVWNYGINGSGVNVSVVDTGINANHPDLYGRVILWKDLVNNLPSPYDDHGHGTHVAGTIAGTGAGGTKTGVAPGANLIVVKVFDAGGGTTVSRLLDGFQWSVDQGADIVSFSGGSTSLETFLGNQDFTVDSGNTTTHQIPVSAYFEDDVSFRPAWIAVKLSSPNLDDLNITLYRPDGTVLAGMPMTWLAPTATDWFYQYPSDSGPLPSGTWNLNVSHTGIPGNHWWYSGKGSFQFNILTSESLDLSNVSSARLQFLSKSDIMDGPGYYGMVQISPANATLWTEVRRITGKAPWHTETVNISSYTGQPVMVRFIYVTSDQSSGNGWYIDDISIPETGYRNPVGNGTNGWLAVNNYWKISGNSTYHFPSDGIVVNYADDGTSPEALMADTLAANGVVPFIAAGNSGIWRNRTVASPGTAQDAVTVGATVEAGDAIAGFSGRGPVGYGVNMVIKPDIVAPGDSIISTSRYGGYAPMSGTSMATPHASGAAALMLQANRSLTPAQVKTILERTALDLGVPGPDINYGAGRINATAAVFNVTGWDMMRGDLNNNGRTDIGDVVHVSYMAAGLAPPNGAADYNHNLRVDAGDAAKIAWYYVGKVSAL